MIKDKEEYHFPYRKRRKLVAMLEEAGFILANNSFGKHIYVANPKECHAKIGKHCLPVAFLRISSYNLLNLDESSLKEYHEKIKEIYQKAIKS